MMRLYPMLLLFLTPLALSEEPEEEVERPTATVEEGIAAFAEIYKTSQSPRCMNCHPDGDVPLQYDDSQPHTMGIDRFSPNVGLPCSTCHRETGLQDIPYLPPADPHWGLPLREQAFQNRTLEELCAQLNDVEATNGRDLWDLAEHVEKDHLLTTSWHSGRTPPPLTHEELIAAFTTWAAAGGPCPGDTEEEE